MILFFSWIAVSDGTASSEEIDALRSIASKGKDGTSLALLIDIARRGRVDDLQLACEVLREVPPENKRLVLQMAVGMALEDGRLTTGEGHIVRLAADLLGQTPSDLDEMFIEITGNSFPVPADPSSIAWWEERDRRSEERSRRRDENPHDAPTSSPHNGSQRFDRLRNLAFLGLDEDATADDIRDAYRRLAKVHHPDRYASLGTEAAQAAHISFVRIQLAYERLTGS